MKTQTFTTEQLAAASLAGKFAKKFDSIWFRVETLDCVSFRKLERLGTDDEYQAALKAESMARNKAKRDKAQAEVMARRVMMAESAVSGTSNSFDAALDQLAAMES